MQIEVERELDVCVLRLSGNLLTGTNVEFLRDKTNQVKSSNCNKVLVDLRELRSIGSTGIGFLLGIYASLAKSPGGRFVLVGPQRRVQEVLDVTRLSSVVPLAPDIASGMALLQGD